MRTNSYRELQPMTYRVFKTFLICSSLTAIFSMTALAADIVAGIVRNQTRSQLAVGDEVVLLRMNQAHPNLGTQEEARANTDSQGSFNLKVGYPPALHLVRVIHRPRAAPTPPSRGNRCVPSAPGIIPRLTSGWPISASGTATR